MKQRKPIEELKVNVSARFYDSIMERKLTMQGESEKILTTQGKFEKMLCEYGLSEKQASEIMEFVKPKIDSIDDYRMTWHRPASEYPDAIYAVVFMLMKPMVVEWAEKNIPGAWWIGLFKDLKK
jgi:hypothetical protein